MQKLLQFISSIIAPIPPASSFDGTPEEEGPEGDVAIDTDIKYATEEEALSALAKSYYAYMEQHYRRKPQIVSDLYCNMLMTSCRGRRFWWIPVAHPIAVVLKNHFDACETDGSQGCVGAEQIGDCVIYEDDVVAFVLSEVKKLFEDEGILERTQTSNKND